MRTIRYDTAYHLSVFMTDSGDNVSGKTGLTLSIEVSPHGGGFSTITPTVTELGYGWYDIYLTTNETNSFGDWALHITAAGADPCDMGYVVAVWEEAVFGAAVEVGGNVAAIKAKTDNLPSDPADESILEAAIAGVPAAVWATVGALGKAYGLMVAENNAAQIIRVGQFQAGSTTQALVLDASASAIDDFYNRTTITIVTGTYAGQNRLINDYVGATKTAYLDRALLGGAPAASDFFAIDSRGNTRSASDLSIGLAQSGAAGYITLQPNASAIDDFYNRMFVLIESGTGEGQARLISDYTGASRQAAVARNWITAPDATSRYVILPFGSVKVSEIDAGVITATEAPALVNLDAAVSTRALEAGGNVAAIKAKTDNLPADPADESILEAAIAGVLADTNDIQSRLPAALVSGRMDSSIGAVTASALTAAAFAAGAVDANALANDAVEEIAMKVLTWASSNWESSAGVKSLGAAVMKAVHRIRDNAGTLEIFRADGTTVHASQTVTTDDTLKPIDELSGAA